jgi:hypothetical protein
MNTITYPTHNMVLPDATEGATMGQRRTLRVKDLTRIWGEEAARQKVHREWAVHLAGLDDLPEGERVRVREQFAQAEAKAVAGAKPLAVRTVYKYLQLSRNGRYENNPVPVPEYPEGDSRHARIPVWVPEQGETVNDLEARLRAWWHSRPGPGVGGGRPCPG